MNYFLNHMNDAALKISRLIRIRGIVQGVGFRPFAYRLACRLGITGSVGNDSEGVVISAYGFTEPISEFIRLLTKEAPPLAVIRSIKIESLPNMPGEPDGFVIKESGRGEKNEIDIARDTAVCAACLVEMRDTGGRRFGHAFINCTDCGPRYTIIASLPYDRPCTAMAGFVMCQKCRAEYEDPASRRFHAQPICCPECGPKLSLSDSTGAEIASADPLASCIDMLAAGKVVAIKGIGGFHLACRADRDESVKLLRERKGREEKPFALMVRDAETAARLAVLSYDERRLLVSVERPIVLLRKLSDPAIKISGYVAPGLDTLGIMLPYAPLHHLLFDRSEFDVLVMTSANFTDEPMVHENHQAIRKLHAVADSFLIHDRPIFVRADDSIARIAADAPVLLRRGRGFVPEPMPAPCDVTGIVGCGGVLKATVSVGRGTSCYVSQYVGSAENLETLEQLDAAGKHLSAVLDVKPAIFAVDLHPSSITARIADPEVPVVRVQHHHAHAAACMAENRIAGKAVCVVYDGTGYGSDGSIWGGEILIADYCGFNKHERAAVMEMLRADVSCVQSSGMGRLFDALSALLGICTSRTYEGQPAIMLEAVADRSVQSGYDLHIYGDIIDGTRILSDCLRDFQGGTPAAVVAGRFHITIANATAIIAERAAQQISSKTVCLSGGCFQNVFLLESTMGALRGAGLTPVTHRLVPPNDESISYGQAVIAGMKYFQK